VVIQSDATRDYVVRGVDRRVTTWIVIPLTSKLKARDYPGALEIRASNMNGLDQDSIATPHQIVTVDILDVKELHGTLSDQDMQRLTKAAAYVLGIEPARAGSAINDSSSDKPN
jgi:mRNA-degrading endonuclease toxin of MazEF toxin-antitoxin module